MKSKNCSFAIIVAALFSVCTAFGQTNTTGTNWVVTITAPDPSASEAGDPGLFTVSRGTNTIGNVPVFLLISGTALNGTDYAAVSNRVLIADGATSVSFSVTPIDDSEPEPTESVVVRVILPPTGFFPYVIGSPNTATVNIADNDGLVPSNQPPVVNIVQPTNNAFFIAPATISLRAFAHDSDGTIASVEFFANNQSLGLGSNIDPNGTVGTNYFLTWNNVAAGEYDLTAKATDDDGAMRISAARHIFVGTNQPPPGTNQAPFVNIVRPTNGAVFIAPTNVAIRASAQDFDGVVVSVEFFADNQSLGFGTTTNSAGTIGNQFFLTWTNVPPGGHDLTAKATDDDGAMRISAPVHIFVGTNQPPPPPTNLPPVVNIIRPTNNAFFAAPATISLEAVARDPDGVLVSVEFFANNNSLGFGSNVRPDGTIGTNYFLTWNNVGTGAYDLTANATDDDGAMRISSARHIFVGTNQPPPPTNQLAVVSISATDPTASEGLVMWCSNTVVGVNWMFATNGIIQTNGPCPTGTNTATFTVRRSGGTNLSLRVYYSIGGSASNGVDYSALTGVVTIPAGARSARIVVTPVNDHLPEGIETVVLRLIPSKDPQASVPYLIGQPAIAAAYITDNDRPPPLCGVLPDGTVHLCAPFTNQCFRVELSTNLVHWAGVCTNRMADGAAHHLDPNATNNVAQFIRFIPLPCTPEDQ